MSHPLDKFADALLKAATEGPDETLAWLKELQEEVGAPDGPELPPELEIEYLDGTKETIDTTKPLAGQGRFPQFYSHDNPAPQDVIDSWSKDEDE